MYHNSRCSSSRDASVRLSAGSHFHWGQAKQERPWLAFASIQDRNEETRQRSFSQVERKLLCGLDGKLERVEERLSVKDEELTVII